MKKLLRLVVFVVFVLGLSAAQTATVTRNVNLRSDPSTDNDPIVKLTPGTTLQLVDPDPTGGYYHVKTADNQTGFVWGKNITISSGAAANPTPTPAPASGTSSGSPVSTVFLSGQELFDALTAKKKAAVGQPLAGTTCGPTGDATNAKAKDLNNNKNRTDAPDNSDLIAAAWDDLKSLPSTRVTDFQGAPVTVIGFLSHKINVEDTGSGESTNCHLTSPDQVDWHIYLTKSPAQGIKDALIVETTPRTRPSHKWTTDMLQPFVDSQTQVRVSGWLIYDYEHVNVIGKERATVWEVHPITRIEVMKDGQWVDLDQ